MASRRKRQPKPPPAEPDPELLAWRLRHKLSQQAAAVTIGCSRAGWQNWEQGKAPTPHFIRLAMQAIDARLHLKGTSNQ